MSLNLMSAIPISSSSIKIEEADKVLNILLSCVQQCQKRYGGKTELATEFDSCVAALCLSLEAALLHGLRTKPQVSTHNNTFKQVSSIVTNSLNLSSENNSFWPFVKQNLTKHEQDRYELLKHIWTDVGKGRAWIRSSLNERSLERGFHIVLSNSELLNSYYDDWALLRDAEKSSMLPNMAAGLGSILFAINIDKPELNSGSALQKTRSIKIQKEPIIEAPIPDNRGRVKQKRKVAKQIISFDEEEQDFSTSSSVLLNINMEQSTSNILINSDEETKSISDEVASYKSTTDKDSFSSTSTGKGNECETFREDTSYDRFKSTEIKGPLTPVEQTDVDKLMPVTVIRGNENSESPDISDDILEVPTDISEVLTAVEAKHKEDIAKVQFQMSNMKKENENLKQQLKQYISAVQMLGQNNDNSLESADIDNLPDYKKEAKVFERKLVQVAEMHAELMDFNVQLQQSLCQKDALIEKLTKELEELRGPVPLNDGPHQTYVHVWIPSAFLTGSGADIHHVYQIFLRAGADEWNIYRRYAQFHALHTDLKKLDPAIAAFDFPPKKSIGKKDSVLVENRRKRLETYLRKVLSHWPELAHCNSRFLLEQHLSFFKDQKPEDKQSKKNVFSPRSSVPNDAGHYSGL